MTTYEILENVVFMEYYQWMSCHCRLMMIEKDSKKMDFYKKLLPFLIGNQEFYHSFDKIRILVESKKDLYE